MNTSLWLLPALLVTIALAAPRYGVDSRDGYDWNRRFGPPDPPPPMASRRRSTPAADLKRVLQIGAAAKQGGDPQVKCLKRVLQIGAAAKQGGDPQVK